MGRYVKQGKTIKEQQYKDDFNAISDRLTTELDRCIALVNLAQTEDEINAIQFKTV